MKTATVYVAVDGRQFTEAVHCKDHEERLFHAWLRVNSQYSEFLKSGSGAASDRRAVIRDFWEFTYGE